MYLFLQDYLVRVPTPACYQPNSTINSIKHVYTLTTDQCMFYGTLNSNSLHHLLYRVPPLCLLSPLLTHNSWEYLTPITDNLSISAQHILGYQEGVIFCA